MNQCKTCAGKGVVLTDLRSFRLGDGFVSFMTAGQTPIRNDDGSVHYEIVCLACDGGDSSSLTATRR